MSQNGSWTAPGRAQDTGPAGSSGLGSAGSGAPYDYGVAPRPGSGEGEQNNPFAPPPTPPPGEGPVTAWAGAPGTVSGDGPGGHIPGGDAPPWAAVPSPATTQSPGQWPPHHPDPWPAQQPGSWPAPGVPDPSAPPWVNQNPFAVDPLAAQRALAGPGYYTPPIRNEPWSIVSLVCGIVGLLIPFVAVPAIVAGHVSLVRQRKSFDGGRGMAITGLVLGYIMVALWLAILLLLGMINAMFVM